MRSSATWSFTIASRMTYASSMPPAHCSILGAAQALDELGERERLHFNDVFENEGKVIAIHGRSRLR